MTEKLAEEIPAKEAAIQKLRDMVSSTDGFIAKAMQTIGFHCNDIGCMGGVSGRTRKAPCRTFPRDSCRGASPSRRYPG